MSVRSYSLKATLTLFLAIAAWVGVGYIVHLSGVEEVARTEAQNGSQKITADQISAAQIHSLANQTATQRGQLESMLSVDIVSVVDAIDALGGVTGGKVSVSTAQPENIPVATDAKEPAINAVGIIVVAQGTLAQVLQVMKLLETLPTLSSVEDMDLGQTSAAPNEGGQWSLNARIRVLTSATISQ